MDRRIGEYEMIIRTVNKQDIPAARTFIATRILRQTSRVLVNKSTHKRKVTKMKPAQTSKMFALFCVSIMSSSLVRCQLFQAQQTQQAQQQQQPQQQARISSVSFPGVSRDVASFCAARPSLPIDLASMIVHIKKNVSFNYKLYLFSGDHVFQTGQVIPRDDFRVHSFPVKFKRMNDFWNSNVPTYQVSGGERASSASGDSLNKETLVPVSSSLFDAKQFFNLVPMNPTRTKNNKLNNLRTNQKKSRVRVSSSTSSVPATTTTTITSTSTAATPTSDAVIDRRSAHNLAPEIRGDFLPGDPEPRFISHDVATVVATKARLAANTAPALETVARQLPLVRESDNPNLHIEFDRDDQVSAMVRRLANFSPVDYLAKSDLDESSDNSRLNDENNNQPSNFNNKDNKKFSPSSTTLHNHESQSMGEYSNDNILPVGSFSSFHVNLTYLVRKDFGQLEPQLIRIQVDPSQFAITQLVIVSPGSSITTVDATTQQNPSPTILTTKTPSNSVIGHSKNDDYDFLSHKLLRDVNTRITSITQIYEDWITRNFYTIVYVQRKLDEFNEKNEQTIVTDRLIFRGSSKSLLGADQLNYNVKAAAFITEKNGLHYYLEFLTNGKFYLCAIDWTKRPFKIIDSRRFPIKSTRVQLDNEELLLCPPAVCYSNQPLDEIISYGRIQMDDKIQRETLILSSSLSSTSPTSSSITNNNIKLKVDSNLLSLLNETNLVYTKQQHHSINQRLKARNILGSGVESNTSEDTKDDANGKTNKTLLEESMVSNSISLDDVIEAIKVGSSQLQTRLHLRDWVWIMPRALGSNRLQHSNEKLSTSSSSNDVKLLSPLSKFEWRYELARRNDIKVKPDTYGYVLTGHEIDASYRIYNELYLISASHLITINYTMANETVVSTHPIVDEFFGLGSTLIDPITGAFYDRYANQIFFFKGDRYVGYDYATRKPLEEFMLQAPMQEPLRSVDAVSLVSNLPVLGILGRQHQVDGVYHDLFTDLVYIFTDMKFYTFEATEFKNGSFKSSSKSLPTMQCINVHFLDGCAFDQAFPNPCRDEETEKSGKLQTINDGISKLSVENDKIQDMDNNSESFENTLIDGLARSNFNDEQQMKLRNIASTRAGLLNLLVGNTLLEKSTRALEPLLGEERSPNQEKIVVYLLMAMIGLSGLITIVMIVLIINWTRIKISKNAPTPQPPLSHLNNHDSVSLSPASTTTFNESLRTSAHHLPVTSQQLSASGNYLNNQRHHHSRRHHQRDQMPSSRRSRDSSIMSNNLVKSPSSANMVMAKTSRRQPVNMDNSVL